MLAHEVLALPVAAVGGLAVVFVVGGVVKGITGVGLPLTLVPLTAQFLPLPSTIALLSVAMAASNITQAAEGGHTIAAVRQMLPVLAALIVGTVIGVHLLIHIDRHLLNAILGVSFLSLSALLFCLPRVRLSPRIVGPAGPVVGLAAGVLGGMSAMFGPPMIAYLVGQGADPDTFVKHMVIFALTASTTMLIALGGSGTMSPADLAVATAALIPIQLGMPIGRGLRRRTNPSVFRLGVLVVLAAGGIDLLHRAFF